MIISKLEWTTQRDNNLHALKTKRRIPANQKKILQKDMEDNIIKIWKSCRSAARELNIKPQNISIAALNQKSSGGFKWQYVISENTPSNIFYEFEIWKPIKEYENLYEVSNFGRVKSLLKNILLLQSTNSGYCRVSLSKNKSHKAKLVHRLVAEAFIPNIEDKELVNHINKIKTDNNINNLEWCTSSENNKHAKNFIKKE